MKKLNLTDQQRVERAKVRMKLVRKKNELRSLEEDFQSGKVDRADLDVCRGEIDVLKKEIESIEQSGHTVFLNAKKMLEPKKDLSAKKKKLSTRKLILERKIKISQKRLDDPGCGDEEKEELVQKIASLQKEISNLVEEEVSIGNFNHTRFLESKKLDQQFAGHEDTKNQVEQKIVAKEQEIQSAKESGDSQTIEKLNEELHLLKMELEAIENFAHEEFLQNVESLKAKRRSDLS